MLLEGKEVRERTEGVREVRKISLLSEKGGFRKRGASGLLATQLSLLPEKESFRKRGTEFASGKGELPKRRTENTEGLLATRLRATE